MRCEEHWANPIPVEVQVVHMLGSLDERLQLFQSCCMIQQRCQLHARRSQLTVLGHHHHHQQLLLLLLLLASPSSACIFSRSRPICLYMCWSVFTVPPHVLFFSFLVSQLCLPRCRNPVQLPASPPPAPCPLAAASPWPPTPLR